MLPVPLPSSTGGTSTPSTAVVGQDARSIQRLVELLVERSGTPQAELARRLGITIQSLNQYVRGRRVEPSLRWMARLAEVCGARLVIEFPSRPLSK